MLKFPVLGPWVSPQISGGQPSPAGQWPWMSLITPSTSSKYDLFDIIQLLTFMEVNTGLY